MRDLDITNRNMYGNVTFGLKSASVSGLERLIQKVTILVLSEPKQTYFGDIVGGDTKSAAQYVFSSGGNSDFKIVFSDRLTQIQNKLESDDIAENAAHDERLKSLVLNDILFDKMTGHVVLSITVTSNSASKTLKLPVK